MNDNDALIKEFATRIFQEFNTTELITRSDTTYTLSAINDPDHALTVVSAFLRGNIAAKRFSTDRWGD